MPRRRFRLPGTISPCRISARYTADRPGSGAAPARSSSHRIRDGPTPDAPAAGQFGTSPSYRNYCQPAEEDVTSGTPRHFHAGTAQATSPNNSVAHLRGNLAAEGVTLDDEALRQLNAIASAA